MSALENVSQWLATKYSNYTLYNLFYFLFSTNASQGEA